MYNYVGFFLSILLILYINNFNVVIKQMQKTYFYTKKKKNPWCWNNHARTKSEDLNEDRDTL